MGVVQDSFINLKNELKTWITNNLVLKANKSNLIASDGASFRFAINSDGDYGFIVSKNNTNQFRAFNTSYAATVTVTYIIDGKTYTEVREVGTDCIYPISFTVPNKSGYLFKGWSYTSNGSILKECIAGSTNFTLYDIYYCLAYDDIYTWSGDSQPSKQEATKNTIYISTVNQIWARIGGDTAEDYTHQTATTTLLTLTNAATSDYKYADITFEYYNRCDFGASECYVDSALFSADNDTDKPYNKTVTWDLSKKTSCNGYVWLYDRSDAYTFWSSGFIGIKRVELYN